MKVLGQILRRVQRLPRAPLLLAAAWFLGLAAIEVLGRHFSSEWVDLAAIFGLAALVGVTWSSHRRRPMRWVASARGLLVRLRDRARAALLDWGVDLRGEPPVPRGWPRRYPAILGALLAVNGALVLGSAWIPGSLGGLLSRVVYVGYALLLAALWSALLLGLLVMLSFSVLAVQERAHRRQWSRRHVAAFAISLLGTVIVAGVFLPLWIPIAAVAALPVAFVVLLLLFRTPRVRLMWRDKAAGGRAYGCDGRFLNAAQLAVVCLAATVLMLVSCGDRLAGTADFGSRPVTHAIGASFAWATLAASTLVCLTLLQWFRRCGKETRGAPPVPPSAVGEMRLRFELLAGFDRLLGLVERREFKNGEGFWIGLQHWFIPGLSRDTDEDELDPEDSWILETVGPHFDHVFSREVRHYYARLMSCLDLDLVFLEDGVGRRGFRRVLNVLFDVYDNSGGLARAEEMHFADLTGVDVMIHDFDMAAPLVETGYSEPNYEQIGRARILHVFKEREEGEDPSLPPVHVRSRPLVPALV